MYPISVRFQGLNIADFRANCYHAWFIAEPVLENVFEKLLASSASK
jgi:hypothetical protein